MKRRGIILLAALTIFVSVGVARPLGLAAPQVFTGPDIGKIFTRLWLPEYPYEARKQSWSGRGTFRAYVEPDGKIGRVAVVQDGSQRTR